MHEPENPPTKEQPMVIEDLPLQENQADALKGGPVEIKELTIRVRVDP